MGRPKSEVPEPVALVTKRVQLLVNEAHRGNVLEASNVTGIPPATLRALFNGKSVNPGLNTLNALREPYGLPPGWFEEEDSSHHPHHGYSFTIRVKQEDGTLFPKMHLGIPWSSWPLPGVWKQLYTHLASLPAGSRPIIGSLDLSNPTDEFDAKARVAAFLFSPLIEEERAFGVKIIPGHPYDARDPETIQRLRLLGLFWQDSLASVLL